MNQTYLKRKTAVVVLIFSLSLIFVQCSSITGPDDNTNLIRNPSFAVKNNASLNGWNVTPDLKSLVNFSNEKPPGGGNWSLTINVFETTPTGVLVGPAVEQTVPFIF